MTGLSRSTDGLDPRRKRMLFRAWHRGTREMDLLMGRYIESIIETVPDGELDALDEIIGLDDHDLYGWLTGARAVPAEHDTPHFRAMKAFHAHSGNIFQ